MPVPARLPVIAAGVVAVAAVGVGVGVVVAGWGDDEPPPRRDATGCPVAVDYVGELLGYEVAVVDDGASTLACRYEPVDPEHPGAHVLIVERSVVDEEGYEAVRSGVEVAASSMTVLDEEALDDLGERAERGWTAQLGRAVQVGIGTVDALYQVVVADPDLPAEEAREVALDLAADAIR